MRLATCRRIPALPAHLLAAVLLASLASDAALAGEIRGHVSIRSALAPRAVGAQHHAGGSKGYGGGYGGGGEDGSGGAAPFTSAEELTHAVVYVAGSALKATPREFTMRQRGREFRPHVLPIVKGSSVRFTNEDPFLHSIYSETAGAQFILPKYGRGSRDSRSFGTPGPVELFCGIHNRMNAYIYVVDNDAFAQPSTSGAFSLADLPPGTYTVRVWHPRLRLQEQVVRVPATGAAVVDFTL